MKNALAILFVAAALSGCVSYVLPEPDADYVPDIALDDLADRMAVAVDPNGTYRKSTSYFMKQDIVTDGKTITIDVTFKVPDKSSTVIYVDGQRVQKTARNGDQCWVYDRNNRKSELVGKDLERIRLFDAISSPKGTLLDAFAKVEFAGEGNVYGSPCYILYAYPKAKDLEPLIRYVSKADYLTRRMITVKDGKPYIASIRKYALVKGVMIATETEMDFNDDGKTDLMTMTDYQLNVDVPDSLFE
jgi:outer membrane lipoprotein-sorting protein